MTEPEHIRHAILVCLYGTRKLPVGASFVARDVSRDVGCESDAVLTELQFMKDAGFVESVTDPFGPTLYFKLTPAGVLQYERTR